MHVWFEYVVASGVPFNDRKIWTAGHLVVSFESNTI